MGETQSKSAATPSVSAAYDLELLTANRLIEASQRGQLDLVAKLLRRGKKVNKVDEIGDNALHKAAAWGHVDIVAALLKKHAELALEKNNAGLTPFHLAAQYGKLECARLLLDSHPKLVNTPFSKNPINFDYSLVERSGKIVWNISNFSRIEEKKIYSDVFQLGGSKWRLVLYPRGSKGDENLSLYLEVANHEKLAEGWSYLVAFTFGVVNQLTGTSKVVRDVVAHRFHKTHTDLGFPQLVKKSALYNRKNGIIYRDRLQVSLALKALDSSTFGLEERCGSYTCRLNGFSKTKDSRMISNTFYIAGAPWALAVYPKGKQVTQTLSIYLKIVPPSLQPHYMSYYSPQPAIRELPADTDEQPNEGANNASQINLGSLATSSAAPSTAAAPSGTVAVSGGATTSTPGAAGDAAQWSYVVNFRISLLNQLNGSKFTRSVDAKIFKHRCEDWGFPQFLKLSTLMNPDNGFLEDDAIVLEVSLEVVECIPPTNAIPTRYLVSTLPSTPVHARPMTPTGERSLSALSLAASSSHAPNTGNPSSSFSGSMMGGSGAINNLNSVTVSMGLQGASSFSVPLRKPISTRSYKQGVNWQVDTPIKSNLNFTPLHWAVFCGNLEAVAELLARQADVDAVDANGRTPLDWACYYGHYDLAKLLLSNNASGKVRDMEHAKPIHKASFLGSPDVIQLMLHHTNNLDTDLAPLDRRRKASFGSADVESGSSSSIARDETHHSINSDATQASNHSPSDPVTGNNVLTPSPRRHLISSKDSSRDGSPLKHLTSSKDSNSAALSDLDALTSSLHETSEEDDFASSMKTETGGVLLLKDSKLASTMHHQHVITSSAGSVLETSSHLLPGRRSSQPHQSSHSDSSIRGQYSEEVLPVPTNKERSNSGPSELGAISASGSALTSSGTANLALNATTQSNSASTSNHGSSGSNCKFLLAVHTPLQMCLRAQRAALVEQLVEDFDGDVNVVDMWGRTPLHLAAYLGDINLLELFLSRCHPQLINHQDRDGFTPLHKAIARGYFDCVQVLLNADSDIGLVSKSGYSPFHYAVLLNELQCAKMILEFDRRRGTAPVPLRENLDGSRRASDVVDSDFPPLVIEKEKKRATVSISDTIQLVRMDHPVAAPSTGPHPAASSSSASSASHQATSSTTQAPSAATSSPPTLHRPPTDRAANIQPLGILHHPPGSEAALARQMAQLKRMRGNNSDEEFLEQKDSVPSDDLLSTAAPAGKKANRRRSVNFHGDNAVVRIKQHNVEESEAELLGLDSGAPSGLLTSNGVHSLQRKSSEILSSDQEDTSSTEGDTSSSSTGDKLNDLAGVLSAGSDDEDIEHEFTGSRARRRSKTVGTSVHRRSGRSTKQHLSDDDSGFRERYYIEKFRDEEDTDENEEDGGPEESSESLSVQIRPTSPSSFKQERGRDREHYQIARRGRSLTRTKETQGGSSAPSSLSLLHSHDSNSKNGPSRESNEAQRQEDAAIEMGYVSPTSGKQRLQNDPNVSTSSRKRMFGSNRSRSTDTVNHDLLDGPSTSPPASVVPSNAFSSTGDIPKPRSSMFSGLLKAISGKTSDSSSTPAAIAAAPTSNGSHLVSSSNGTGAPGSEGARLRRAKIRRASSSSSLESSNSIVNRKKLGPGTASNERTGAVTAALPTASPPTSPIGAPSKSHSKLSASQNASSAQAHNTARFEEPAATTRKTRKSRSPPPAGRRPKSGSISTAERDHVISAVSPRSSSPRTLTGSSKIYHASDDSQTPSNTTSASIQEATASPRHTKSTSDGGSIEGRVIDLHRHSERVSADKSSDKVGSDKLSERMSEKSKDKSTENMPEKATEMAKGATDHSTVESTTHSSAPSSIVMPQKRRGKTSKSSKSDLRVQINMNAITSPLTSPSPPAHMGSRDALSFASGSAGVSGEKGGSTANFSISAPIYSALEILQMPDVNGWLPLHTSVKQGNIKLTQYILSRGASVHDLANGMSVLDLAIQNQDSTLTTLLLEQGAPIMEFGPGLQAFVSQKIILAKNIDLAPSIPASSFIGDMRALLNNSQFYDVTFMVEGKPVYGWKGLLATRCEVFRAMFTGTLREANESNITISDVSYNSFYRIIEFIYTDSITSDKMTLEDALHLLAAANRYMLDRLKRIVERWLLSQLTDSNVSAIFHAADLYQAHHLRSSCILYVSTHLHRIPDPYELLNGTFRGVLLDFMKHPTNHS